MNIKFGPGVGFYDGLSLSHVSTCTLNCVVMKMQKMNANVSFFTVPNLEKWNEHFTTESFVLNRENNVH